MQPYILGAADTMNGIVKGNQGNLEGIAGDIRGMLPQLKNWAMGSGNTALNAGMGYAQDVLGGKYLNGNPYTEAMAHQGEQDAGNAVNSAFSMAGRTGGGRNIQSLARGVAQAGNTVRFGQYNAERQNQQQAAGMLPAMTAAQYSGISPYLAAAQTAGGLPYAGAGALGGLLGMGAGAGTSSGTQPGGWGTQLASAAASALPFIFSDLRLKEDVEYTGRSIGGVPEVAFEYRKDTGLPRGRQLGVIAQDVARLRPDALGPVIDGYMTIVPAVLGDLN